MVSGTSGSFGGRGWQSPDALPLVLKPDPNGLDSSPKTLGQGLQSACGGMLAVLKHPPKDLPLWRGEWCGGTGQGVSILMQRAHTTHGVGHEGVSQSRNNRPGVENMQWKGEKSTPHSPGVCGKEGGGRE